MCLTRLAAQFTKTSKTIDTSRSSVEIHCSCRLIRCLDLCLAKCHRDHSRPQPGQIQRPPQPNHSGSVQRGPRGVQLTITTKRKQCKSKPALFYLFLQFVYAAQAVGELTCRTGASANRHAVSIVFVNFVIKGSGAVKFFCLFVYCKFLLCCWAKFHFAVSFLLFVCIV
jgi:hypothetical protein